MTHVIGAELDLVPVLRSCGWNSHYSGVVHEDVQTRGRCVDYIRRLSDAAQRCQVEREKDDFCGWHCILDANDRLLGFLLGSCGEIDSLRVVFSKLED